MDTSICCYAYSKMFAAKMVFMRFFFGGEVKQIQGANASQVPRGYLPGADDCDASCWKLPTSPMLTAVNFSHGSVATHLRCCKILVIALNVLVKAFSKLSNI